MHLHLAVAAPSSLGPAVLVAASMAVACAALSVFVVSRRWAFIGEGISHSGFGGAGTAWLLALAFPGVFEKTWMPYAGVVVFSFATALAIGYLTRRQRVDSDTAIGIFLVASLAWGFLAQQVYTLRTHRIPAGFQTFLFGQMDEVTWPFAIGAAMVCAAVIAVLTLLGKEILSYCFDPAIAETAGVPAGMIHYLLMVLLAATIVVGARVTGTVLVAALLVLPGATALQLGSGLRSVLATSVLVGLLGAMAGLAIRAKWPAIPTGPAIVLVLFLAFVAALVSARVRGNAAPSQR